MSYPVVSHDRYPLRKDSVIRVFFVRLAAAIASLGVSFAAPSNDSVRQALGIAGKLGQVAGSTREATAEPGEPHPSDLTDPVSVWYQYQAFARGPLTLTLQGAPADTRLVVYEQRGFPLSIGGIVPEPGVTPAQTVTFPTALSTTYVIGVISPRTTPADFTLAWQQAVPADSDIDLYIPPESLRPQVQIREFKVANEAEVADGCAKVGVRRMLAVDFDVQNRGKEDLVLGEDYLSPWHAYSTAEMWYRFIGFWRMEMFDTNSKLVAAIEPPMIPSFSGTRRWNPQASEIKRFNFDRQGLRGGWTQKVQSFWSCQFIDITDIAPGDYTVTITVDPWNRVPESNEDNNTVSFPVAVPPLCTAPPPNDNRTNAMVIEGVVATVTVQTECATAEPGERRHYLGSPASRSVWFKWTAPYTGDVILSTEKSSFDTVLEVQGAAVTGVNGPSIATSDDLQEFDQASYLHFQAVLGTTYWFVVDGLNQGDGATAGTLVLSLNPAGNNAFDHSERLAGVTGERYASTLWTDREAGEPGHGGSIDGHSVWYRWVAPVSGNVTFQVVSAEFDPLLSIYTGDALESLTPVIPQTDRAEGEPAGYRYSFPVAGGQAYDLAVDGVNDSSGQFHLTWEMDVKAEPPRFSVIRRRGGSIRVTVNAQDGETYEVYRSLDLQGWRSVGHVQMVGPVTSWTDAQGPTLPCAFYRIVRK